MPISVACPKCEKKLQAPDAAAGKKLRCPACKGIVMVPDEFVDSDDLVEPDPEPPVTESPAAPNTGPDWDRGSADFVKIQGGVEGEYGLDERDEAERAKRKRKQGLRADEDADGRVNLADRRPRKEPQPHRGTRILLFGFLSMVTFICPLLSWFLAAVALSMANNDLPIMERDLMDKSGKGLTTAGQVCGYLGIILGLVGCVLIGMYVSSLLR